MTAVASSVCVKLTLTHTLLVLVYHHAKIIKHTHDVETLNITVGYEKMKNTSVMETYSPQVMNIDFNMCYTFKCSLK